MKHYQLFLLLLCLASCKVNYYQVYEAKSPELTQKDNSMVFENEDCKISYNLWRPNGSMAFIFENKTNKDIFIDMTQTFFIKNGAANDYYKNRTYETRTIESLSLGYSVSQTYIGVDGYWPSQYAVPLVTSAKKQAEVSKAVSIKESEYVCVPAKSYKVIDYYNIYPQFEKTCDKKKDYPRIESTLNTYDESNSPLKFKNKIAYSFQKNNSSLKHIENSFWLSSIKNYSKKGAIEKRKIREGCRDYDVEREFFIIGGPNQFYVYYNKENNRYR